MIELGTKEYPYKNIGLPFAEILNYHAHSDRKITVFVKERTSNQLLWKSNFIVNITQVKIDTYSDSTTSTPDYADISIKSSEVEFLSKKTAFNVLKHTTLRLSTVLRKDEMANYEISNGKKFPTLSLLTLINS